MKILVIGATGKTGQKLLKSLSTTDHDTYGLMRDPAQATSIECHSAKIQTGDLSNNMENETQDYDAIMFVAGSRGKDVEGIDYKGLERTVSAAVKNNIKRFLYISSINIGKSTEQIVEEIKQFYQSINEEAPEGLMATAQKPGYQTYLQMKDKAEQALIDSRLDYTIIRAGLLTLDSGDGKVNVTKGTLNAFGKVSRENIAQCFVEVLENKNTYGKIYTILDGRTIISPELF